MLQRAELSARSRLIGLWSIPNPTAPWAFRGRAPTPTATPQRAVGIVAAVAGFLGNTNSHVVHASDCPALKTCKYCTLRFESVDAAVKAGYRAHRGNGGCMD